MTSPKPIHLLMSTSQVPILHDGMVLIDPSEYRSMVYSLQYFSLTHPDIAFSVNRLSQFMHHPIAMHWSS